MVNMKPQSISITFHEFSAPAAVPLAAPADFPAVVPSVLDVPAAAPSIACLPRFLESKVLTKTITLPTELLGDNLAGFMRSFEHIVKDVPSRCGHFSIEEIELSLVLDAAGKFSLVAELSAGIHSSISLKLKRT